MYTRVTLVFDKDSTSGYFANMTSSIMGGKAPRTPADCFPPVIGCAKLPERYMYTPTHGHELCPGELDDTAGLYPSKKPFTQTAKINLDGQQFLV